MVADSRRREKTFKIKKKILESTKYLRVKKKIMKSRKKLWNREKKLKSGKIFRNREKYFRIEKTVSESRNILFEESRKNLWN